MEIHCRRQLFQHAEKQCCSQKPLNHFRNSSMSWASGPCQPSWQARVWPEHCCIAAASGPQQSDLRGMTGQRSYFQNSARGDQVAKR